MGMGMSVLGRLHRTNNHTVFNIRIRCCRWEAFRICPIPFSISIRRITIHTTLLPLWLLLRQECRTLP